MDGPGEGRVTPEWVRRAKAHTLPVEVTGGEPRNGPRCSGCGRYFTREEVEAAQRHFDEGCPQKPWAGLRVDAA